MDTSIIEVRTVVPVRLDIKDSKASSTVTVPININFIPDEMICKLIYFQSVNDSGAANITSTICPGFFIPVYTFAGFQVTYAPSNIIYKVTQPINGYYQFNFNKYDNTPLGDVGVLACTLLLEFVKYKSVQPQKIY